jgi:hypothetical protein
MIGISCAILSASLPRQVAAWESRATNFVAPVEGRGKTSAERRIAVKLDIDEDSLSGMTHREKLDQVRDWMLLAAISATGLPPERINEVTFDLSVIRHGYLRPVSNFQYGLTRSLQVDDESVVALIPEGKSAAESAELVGQIADEHRKNSGDKPGKLLLFQYKIDLAGRAAELTRSEDVSAQELFSPSYGYTEVNVNNLTDFKRFMVEIEELTFARANSSGGITLGGRKIKGRNHRGIRVEDVAALWQSEEKISRREQGQSDLIRRIGEFDSRWEQAWREFDARWQAYYGTLVTAQVAEQHKREKAQLTIRQKRERARLLAEVAKEKQAPKPVSGSGFSLDPTYDFAGLLRLFDTQLRPSLQRIARSKKGGFTLNDVILVRKGLVGRNADPLMRLLGKLAASGEERLAQLIQATLNDGYSFQNARYDGDLQGTEVGMVLFYTDLLAKLWAMDYLKSTPTSSIKDLRPVTDLPISPAYQRELEELTSSRLWFGQRQKGYQLSADGQTFLLGPIATRVYAASSDPFNPGVETTASKDTATFLEWWDDHYEEVARFEPEYERLNEIMKWSLLIGWLNNEEKGNALGFLASVPVNRSNWFPDWARQHPELKFQEWDKIGFFPRGYKGTRTEAMPLLFSKPYIVLGKKWSLSGGVSLARKGSLRERVTRVRAASDINVKKELRRASITPVKSAGNNRSLVMQTEDGTTFNIGEQVSGGKTVSIVAKPEARLRGTTGELANVPLRRTTAAEPGGFKVELEAEGVPLGRLEVKGSQSAIRIGWQGRDIDAGQSLVRRLSRHPDPEKVLALDPQVEAAYQLGEEGQYLVKMKNSDSWMKVVEGGGGAGGPPRPPFKAAVADPGGEPGRRYELAWHSSEEAGRDLGAGHIKIKLVEQEVLNEKSFGQGIKLQTAAGEPPAGATPVKITSGQEVINATVDASTGTLYFKVRELPTAFQKDPALVGKRLQPSDLQEVNRLAKSSPAGVEYNTTTRPSVDAITGEAALGYKLIETGRYTEAVQHLSALIKTNEQVPVLKTLRAIARLKQGRAKTATDELNALASRPGQNAAHFFDEVNSRLKVFYGADVYYAQNGKTYDLHYRFDSSRPKLGAEAKATSLDVDIYVQDSPELINMDWSPSAIPNTVNEVIAGGLGKGARLPPGGADTFRPTVIYDEGGGGKRYVLKGRMRQGTPTAEGLPRVLGHPPIYGCYDDDDADEETECAEFLEAKPILLITDARQAQS